MEKEKRVLVVEPDPNTAEKLGKVLGKDRISVKQTQRASEAIRTLQQEHYCAMVLDVEIADMAWDEMVPIVKGLTPSLPIIMTSTANTPELEARILHQKVFYYHVKSFGSEDLILAVKSAVEKPAAGAPKISRQKEAP